MTIVHLLERNAREFAQDVALVEINPDQPETRKLTWHEYELVEPTHKVSHYRREITWAVFNEKANRLANMLKQNGIGKGNKVAILLMNCIDWLPIYFGILKAGHHPQHGAQVWQERDLHAQADLRRGGQRHACAYAAVQGWRAGVLR